MRVIRMTAENFKKIKCVEIKPDGNVVTISGRNGQGKSSVLDALCVALSGKSAAPKKPIRNGETKAVIVVETESIIVTRRFTAAGSYLEVANKDGAVFKSPQAVLDTLVGAIAFDPLAFVRQTDREQAQTFIELTGVDLQAHDKTIVQRSEHRRQLMAQKKTAELDLSRLPMHTDAPAEEVSIAALAKKLTEANAENKRQADFRQQTEGLMRALVGLQEREKALQEELRQVQNNIAASTQAFQEAQETLKTMVPVSVEELTKQIESIDATNRKVRENQEYGKAKAAIDKLAAEIHADYQQIQQAEADKANALAQVQLPLEGLSVDENGVTYQGIPLSQVNHAKKLEVSLAIGMAMNPKLRVMLIDGNGLDSETRQVIYDLATKHDFQVWEERTEESGKVGVYLEAGEVLAVNGRPVEKKPTKEEAVEALLQ